MNQEKWSSFQGPATGRIEGDLGNSVAAGIADRLEVQIAYAIGVSHPVSIMVDSFGTAKISEDKIN